MSVKYSGRTVREVFGHKGTPGDVGIEIEMEARPGPEFPSYNLPTGWVPTHDNSLRGISVEYVLSQPIPIDRVSKAISSLNTTIKEACTRVQPSIRTGVHVHINCQELTMQQLLMYAAVYYSLENVLVDWCGPNRVGNLFCLRAKDAEGVLPHIGSCFAGKSSYASFGSDSIRYASMNFCAVRKFGSLEFRAMATDPQLKGIEEWAKILIHLREKSKELGSIEELLERFSMATPREWAQECLGDFYEEVRGQKDLEPKIWEGIYCAQDLLFFSS